jgi:hypothetical protein
MKVTSDRITGGLATLQSSSRLLHNSRTQRAPERRVNIFELRQAAVERGDIIFQPRYSSRRFDDAIEISLEESQAVQCRHDEAHNTSCDAQRICHAAVEVRYSRRA